MAIEESLWPYLLTIKSIKRNSCDINSGCLIHYGNLLSIGLEFAFAIQSSLVNVVLMSLSFFVEPKQEQNSLQSLDSRSYTQCSYSLTEINFINTTTKNPIFTFPKFIHKNRRLRYPSSKSKYSKMKRIPQVLPRNRRE
jgi:hypothetical protein